MPLTRDEDIADLLRNARTIAVIGASDRPDRPSYGVMKFLQEWGYRVLPVNPQITGEHVLGEFVWRELAQIGIPIDIVDIFRRPEAAAEAVEQAIFVGAKAVWMQLGVINEEAAAQQQAQSYINNANAYALQRVRNAQGEAAAFDKVYQQYKLAPEVTRRRMYYETMEQVLSKLPKTIVEAPGVTPYLPLPQVQKEQQGQQEQQQ
jgi:hypothetical protein